MSMRLLFLAGVVSVSCVAACGGTTVVSPGSSGTGAGITTSTTTSTSSTSGPGPTGCPASTPSGSCAGATDGLTCSYGDSPVPACRTLVMCSAGQWMPVAPEGTCSPPPSGACPATEPMNGETTCTPMSDLCTYGDTLCVCDPCAEGPCMAGATKWTCSNVQGPPSCPDVAPNQGTACSGSETCTYGYPCAGNGATAQCTNGAWTWIPTACPG